MGGFDRASGLAYVWWGQALLGAVNMWAWRELADRVRSGDIAIDFARPLNLPLSYLVQDLGRAAVNLLGRAWPMLLIGFLFVRMAPPPNLTAWLLGALAILFAIMVSFCGNYLINTLAFWIIEIRGVQMVYMVVSTFFAGLFVPVSWMPTPLPAGCWATATTSWWAWPWPRWWCPTASTPHRPGPSSRRVVVGAVPPRRTGGPLRLGAGHRSRAQPAKTHL